MHTPIILRLKWSLAVGLLMVIMGCDGGVEPEVAADATVQENTLPPGFLDEPPPGPTSDTVILSGGTLIQDDLVADAVVVINKGNLVAWGQRGSVEVPNDSIGLDMRGKWLWPLAGEDGDPAQPAQLIAGDAAKLRIFNSQPETANHTDIHGELANGELTLAADAE